MFEEGKQAHVMKNKKANYTQKWMRRLCVCVRACVLTQCAKSEHCACSTHVKCSPSTKSGYTRGPLLVLISDLESPPLKTQELTLKLWGSLSPLLAWKLFFKSFYIWIKVRSSVKITYILVSTSHAKCWPFKYWWSSLNIKVCKNIRVRPWWRSFVCVCVCVDIMRQERTLCMHSPCQERTSNQEYTHSRFAVGFGMRFGLVILKNPGIDHKIIGVAWVCPWHWNYFSNHFIHERKSALGQNLTHSSPHFTC